MNEIDGNIFVPAHPIMIISILRNLPTIGDGIISIIIPTVLSLKCLRK